ncbi:MAG TPA: endonuclease/exonuclease/phosphatase family protein [Thermoanaerobaculales bacterium]|nr:endonuclease/exonuclease/phosphatase family protein [Thermoanaerobaculales bacterium]
MTNVRLLVWNIRHGGGERTPRILAVLEEQRPDVVVLTEFRNNRRGEAIREWLADNGFVSMYSPRCGARVNTLLVASRAPATFQTFPADLGRDAHRIVLARTSGLSLFAVYFPQLRAKGPIFDFLLALPDDLLQARTAICGDFNTGKHFIDEKGTTFALAERFSALEEAGWIDAWRQHHGTAREYSWYSSKRNGFRVDHIFASPTLAASVLRADYLHDVRLRGISDHSALIAEIHVV